MTKSEEAEAEWYEEPRSGGRDAWAGLDHGESQVVSQHEFRCSPAAHLNFDPLHLFVLSSEKQDHWL